MIELQQLTRRFGDFTAVREMSLRVEEGELLVLVGGSGSGKTTTLKMINRLIEPTSGTVLIDGRDTRGMRRMRSGGRSAMPSSAWASSRT